MWRLFAMARYWEQFDAAQPHWPATPNFNDKTRPWFDSWGNAVAAYEAIHLHDPRGPLADSAEMASANMYFRAGHYEDAAFHYDIIRKDYPKSKYQLQAHLLGLQSKMRMYQGPVYDASPLKDAAEIADQTLKQFRGRLGDEEASVVADHGPDRGDEGRAGMGRWPNTTTTRNTTAAARQYYKFLIDNYPRTPYAEQARARLTQIRNEPDTPANRFKWLTRCSITRGDVMAARPTRPRWPPKTYAIRAGRLLALGRLRRLPLRQPVALSGGYRDRSTSPSFSRAVSAATWASN